MGYPPPQEIIDEFLGPTSQLYRRVEIYENDGEQPWRPELWNRLVDGSVTVDYGRDERRTLDVSLDNFDDELHHAPSNLWYDKVLKVFYGINVNQKPRVPSICIVEEFGASGQALHVKSYLNAQGFTKVRVLTQITTLDQVLPYDIIISLSADYTRKLTLLQQAFDAGISVFTANLQSTTAQLPQVIGATNASTTAVTGDNSISINPAEAHPLNSGWAEWVVLGAKTFRRITAVASGASHVGRWYDAANLFSPGIIAYERPAGARWVHLQQIEFNPANVVNPDGLSSFLGRAMEWLDTYEPIDQWETQIGEFMIDGISNNEYNDIISITGRDYTKRCLLSKFVNSTAYAVGQNVGTIIRSIAVNAGISKFNLPIITDTLPRDVVYERGVERWTAMKEIADATNFEIFFDAQGYLTMRKYNDPLLTPPTLELRSGEGGNLVSSTNKAADARLFNHVVVTGESSNSQIPPVAAEALNNLASSPSSVQRIGDRVIEYKSSLVTTVAQAQELANTYLRVSSLEEFEMDFSSILLPWIEPGEIIEIEEYRSGQYMPTRYLLSSLTFPLDLGPMSGNGKRVTIVL